MLVKTHLLWKNSLYWSKVVIRGHACMIFLRFFDHSTYPYPILSTLSWFTVQRTPVSTKPFLCTKRPNLTLLFYYIKVPAHSCPQHPILSFTWALKWGTVWTSISTGMKTIKFQSIKVERKFIIKWMWALLKQEFSAL